MVAVALALAYTGGFHTAEELANPADVMARGMDNSFVG